MTPRWSTASIRVRLTGWYTAVLCLMLVVYASATFVAVRHEFLEQLDELPKRVRQRLLTAVEQLHEKLMQKA